VAFEHSYMPASLESNFEGFNGSSSFVVEEPGLVGTTIVGSDGNRRENILPGHYIRKSVQEWLEVGGVPSLDSKTIEYMDYRNKSRHPPFRMIGVALDFRIVYDNRNPDTKKPEYHTKRVHANVHVSRIPFVAPADASVYYSVPFTTDAATGAEIFDKTVNNHATASFRFRCEGTIHIFGWGPVFTNLIASLVMMRVAKKLAIAYALRFHPRATMLQHATQSSFDVSDGLGTIGMKGALAALEFERLNPDNKDQVTLARLVSIYAKIQSVTFEQAYAVAHLVMDVARRRGTDTKATVVRRSSVSLGDSRFRFMSSASSESIVEAPVTLNFDNILHIQEGHRMISWQNFLQIAEEQAAPLTMQTNDKERNQCLIAFEQQQQQVSSETIGEVTSCSTEAQEEVLERSFSELKIDLDRKLACEFCKFTSALEDIQAKVEAMLENEPAEARQQRQQRQRPPLSKDMTREVMSSTTLQELLVRSQSELLKADLDEQIAHQARKLETAMRDMRERCAETELQLREHVTRFEREIAGTMDQVQEARCELREKGARVEREDLGMKRQALHKTPMLKGAVADRRQPGEINMDDGWDPLMLPVGADPVPACLPGSPSSSSLQWTRRAGVQFSPREPALPKSVEAKELPPTSKPEGRGSVSSFWIEYMLDRNGG